MAGLDWLLKRGLLMLGVALGLALLGIGTRHVTAHAAVAQDDLPTTHVAPAIHTTTAPATGRLPGTDARLLAITSQMASRQVQPATTTQHKDTVRVAEATTNQSPTSKILGADVRLQTITSQMASNQGQGATTNQRKDTVRVAEATTNQSPTSKILGGATGQHQETLLGGDARLQTIANHVADVQGQPGQTQRKQTVPGVLGVDMQWATNYKPTTTTTGAKDRVQRLLGDHILITATTNQGPPLPRKGGKWHWLGDFDTEYACEMAAALIRRQDPKATTVCKLNEDGKYELWVWAPNEPQPPEPPRRLNNEKLITNVTLQTARTYGGVPFNVAPDRKPMTFVPKVEPLIVTPEVPMGLLNVTPKFRVEALNVTPEFRNGVITASSGLRKGGFVPSGSWLGTTFLEDPFSWPEFDPNDPWADPDNPWWKPGVDPGIVEPATEKPIDPNGPWGPLPDDPPLQPGPN